MNPYRIKVSVRNHLLLSAIEDAGYRFQTDFARSAGISVVALNSIVNMRRAPIMSDGCFSEDAKLIMEALGAAPLDLWTDAQLTMALEKNSSESSFDQAGLDFLQEMNTACMTLPDPFDQLSHAQNKAFAEATLSLVSPRDAKVLRMRFGIGCEEHTRNEIAEIMEISTARIAQLEARALRKLADRVPKSGSEIHQKAKLIMGACDA